MDSQLHLDVLAPRGQFSPRCLRDMLRRSGYLDLRGDVPIQPLPEWYAVPDGLRSLSQDLVYQAEDGTLLGHISVTQAYSRAWLGHQLLSIKGHPESPACRRALYDCFASGLPRLSTGQQWFCKTHLGGAIYSDADWPRPLQNYEENRFLFGYYDPHQRWHQLFFEDFVRGINDDRLAALFPMDRFEAHEKPSFDREKLQPGQVVELAFPEDIRSATDLVRWQLPGLVSHVFDIQPSLLFSNSFGPDFDRAKARRQRHVLVAREQGQIVGVALCETGSPVLSLFNLFNMAQVYAREGIDPALHTELFAAARRFYHVRDVHDPMIVAPPGQCHHPEGAGLELEETMGAIFWSSEVLPRYAEHVSSCFEKISDGSLTRPCAEAERVDG